MVLAAILVIAALLLVNALYVAAEFAAVSVRRSRLHQLAEDGNPFAAWLLPIVESPAALDRYIAACQIGITISSLVLGAYAQATLAVWLAPYFAAVGGTAAGRGPVHVHHRRPAGAHRRPGGLCGAGAEVACAPVPDADVALHPDSDGGVAVDVSPVHHVAERIGPPDPSSAWARRIRRIATFTRRTRSSCSSRRAVTVACSSPTSIADFSARCGSTCDRLAS